MAKNPKERGLGMGLGALFESTGTGRSTLPNNSNSAKGADASAPGDDVKYIGINDIKPNSNQPRKNFDEDKIQDLADSIVEHGIIQPLIVRPAKVGYEIVAGERRYRAARKAGLKSVPCLVREFTDRENMLIAIIENMQREDLDPIEEAEGLEQMIKAYGLTQEEVSKSVGKSRPYITNSLRLLNLSQEIKDMIAQGDLTPGHARALLSIDGEAKRLELAKRIVKSGLSVRDVERLASGKGKKAAPKAKARKSRDIQYVEQELKDIFGTKVNIETNGTKGKVEFEYYSREELNRLIDIFRSLK
ncbi:MAG: ParB/RepB/Spo0J family partition protein [Firmicutes bacterium]|nr:ParB/RepB/Spo0J family partition protein [Bacillota bacterium]